MRLCLRALVAASMLLGLAQAGLAAWPEDKPIEIVVGFPPGGGTDLLARKMVPFLQKRMDKAQFVVVNKLGATGEIANAYVANAKPDGYTVGFVNSPAFEYVPMLKKSQYAVSDFRLIARVVADPTVLVTRTESRYNTINEVIAELKQKPRSLSFGHNGIGSNGELVLIALATSGIEGNSIPFKGTPIQKTDLLGGHIDFGLMGASEVPELHGNKPGPLKVICQFSDKRSTAFAQVPTATEQQWPILMSSERGLAGPKNLSADIASRLEAAIGETLRDPEFMASAAGDVPVLAFMPGAQWQQVIHDSSVRLQKIADTRPKQ